MLTKKLQYIEKSRESDKSDVTYFKSMSILPVFAKIFESIIAKGLSEFC